MLVAQQKDRPSQPDFPGEIMLDFGLNGLSDRGNDLALKAWPSKSFGIYYNRIFMLSQKFAFSPSLGLAFEQYAFEEDMNFQEDGDRNVTFSDIDDVSVKKNKLAVNYLELPVEFRFYPTKSVAGEGLFIGLGGVAGLRINARTKIKYTTADDETRVEKLRDTFGLNNVRYGVQARFGIKGINVFYKQYFSTLFKSGRAPGEKDATAYTIGVNITGF